MIRRILVAHWVADPRIEPTARLPRVHYALATITGETRMKMSSWTSGACMLLAATWAQAQAPACLTATPAPTTAKIVYGGSAAPVNAPIDKITPTCVRLNYSGNALWTTANAAGGISCVGNAVQVDYTAASKAFNGMNVKNYMPAACAPAQPAPSGPPPAAAGSTVNVYYGKTIDMATVPLVGATADCYEINYGGNKMWFPKTALGYRTEFAGNPVGLDYNARRSTPCGVAAAPIPPVAAATSPCPPCTCLRATPAPTSALVTYGGKAQPVTVAIEKILPSCLRFNYSGSAIWTTADAKGGVSCVGNNVQLDYGAANTAFNGMNVKEYTPAACAPAQAAPAGAPPVATGPNVNIYYGKTIDMASVPLVGTSANCYQVNYGGNKMWFPKSALGYRSDFVGNPVGLDYNARKNSAC